MDSNTVQLIIIIVCVIFSGYFSATETAFSSLNRIKIKHLADKGDKNAMLVHSMSENYDSLLSTILVGNNIVNIAMASLAAVLFVDMLGQSYGPSVSTIVITIVVLIFGEISPKSIAKESPEKFAMFSAPLLKLLMTILTPVNFLFSKWKKLLSAVFKSEDDSAISEEELLTYVEEAHQGGGIMEQQSTLIRNAIELTDIKINQIMTPRPDIEAVEIGTDTDEIADLFAESGFSRLPFYDETIDNIKGVIYSKDFYNLVYRKNQPIASILRTVLYCTENTKAGNLLKQLQQKKAHIAVVIDEFGGTVGIVTLEDILEELVGEIWDEHDEVEIDVEKLAENQYLVLGSANVEELFEMLDLEQEFDVVTVSGWVTAAIGRIPVEGEELIIDGMSVSVKEVAGNRIEKLLLTIG